MFYICAKSFAFICENSSSVKTPASLSSDSFLSLVKANEGALTSGETAELESYIYVEDLLAYWQTRARQFLEPPA